MSVRMERNTRHLTPADWRALVANGVAVKRTGATGSDYTIENTGLVEVLISAFTDAPECSTMADVTEHGFALDHLVHNIVGLPEDDDRKVPAEGTLAYAEYIPPEQGVGSIIQRRLGGRYDGAVQSELVPKNKFLVSTMVYRDFTSKTTGITSKRQERVWAIAVSAELIDALVLEPEIKRAFSAAQHAAFNAMARMTAVPESAPLVLAALDAEIMAANSARETAYAKAIEGKTSEEVAALDTAVDDLAESKARSAQRALTGGSDESSADDDS